MSNANSTDSDDQLRKEYTNEEVSEIIRIALDRRNGGEDAHVDRDELLSIAKEFGLTIHDLARASEQLTEVDEEKERAALAWKDFKLNLGGYGVGVIGLFALNLATYVHSPQWWFQFAAIAYGAIVLGHFVMAKFNPELAYTMLRGEEEEELEDVRRVTPVKEVKH